MEGFLAFKYILSNILIREVLPKFLSVAQGAQYVESSFSCGKYKQKSNKKNKIAYFLLLQNFKKLDIFTKKCVFLQKS